FASIVFTMVTNEPREEVYPMEWRRHEERPVPGTLEELRNEDFTNLATIEPVPPNGGYGWVCMMAVFLVNAHTWGVNASWAVIMAHYTAHPDLMKASRLEYALIGGLSISQALMISPVVNKVREVVGPRVTLLIGSALIFVSLFASSFATQIWQMFLSQALCFGWGMGFVYLTATAMLPSWFSSRRSLAVGLATSGAGIGGLIYSIATNYLIQGLGLGWTYRVLACCALIANVSASFMLKDFGARSHHPLRDDLRLKVSDFGRVEIFLIVIWGISTELGYIILLYSLPSYASSIGLTASQGSVANALLNLGLALGRPPVGYLSDVFGRITMAGAMTMLCSIFCFALWIPAHSYGPLLAFALLSGMVCGVFWCTITPVLVEVVGLGRLPGAFGVICIAMVLPTTFAEPIAVRLVADHGTGFFLSAQIFAGCMFICGSVSLWFLRSWKISAIKAERSELAPEAAARPRKPLIPWLRAQFLFSIEHA
ncbi:hypothetical protein LLEC1_04622, partial [Akanthomyces lecanii]